MLYTVCRQAQAGAGQAAVDAAQGLSPGPHPETALSLLCEATREHLWRLLLDWPQLLGLTTHEAEFADWYRRLATAGRSWSNFKGQLGGFASFAESAVLGMHLPEWRALASPDEFESGTALASRLWRALDDDPGMAGEGLPTLPPGSAAEFAAVSAAEWNRDFARTPTLHGRPAETGALARWQTHPLIRQQLGHGAGAVRLRLFARLMDLAQCAEYIAAADDWLANGLANNLIDTCSPAPGVGIARVETARGILLHRVRLEGTAKQASIAEYAVVAPTEWNFHPGGAFVAAMHNMAMTDEAALRKHAQRLVLALDPCVPCHLEVSRA